MDRLHWTLDEIDRMQEMGYENDLLAMLWYFSKKSALEKEKADMNGQSGGRTGPVH